MKNNKHIPIIVLIVALISFGCLSLGVSYSFVSRSRVSGTALVITTGDLTSEVNYEAVNYMLSSMDDESGVAQEQYGKITVSKDNVYTVFYTLNIGYAVDSLASGQSVGNLLPMEYIKVALFEMENSTVASTPIVGPVSLSDLVVSEISGDSNFRNKYLLHFGDFAAGSDSDVYALKVWIDDSTPETYDESLVYLSVSVDQETMVNKTLYQISGSILNSSGVAMTSACYVNLNNGSISSTGTGNYTLTQVPNGTYPISIKCGDAEYRTTLSVQTGDTISLQSVGNITSNANTYLASSAYTYYTTPGMILRLNNLSTTTNQLSTSTYTIPTAYVLTAPESLSLVTISNINLQLNTNGTITVSKGA